MPDSQRRSQDQIIEQIPRALVAFLNSPLQVFACIFIPFHPPRPLPSHPPPICASLNPRGRPLIGPQSSAAPNLFPPRLGSLSRHELAKNSAAPLPVSPSLIEIPPIRPKAGLERIVEASLARAQAKRGGLLERRGAVWTGRNTHRLRKLRLALSLSLSLPA